uniref:Uncharacterized protein n=1 Tax=Rhizophora mucronata TaxID=61149 RepID=A0A2P2PZP5_RHIMU
MKYICNNGGHVQGTKSHLFLLMHETSNPGNLRLSSSSFS